MPIIQITTSVRAISITEPLHLKAGEWLMVMDDDTYRKATKSEAASLAEGAAKKERTPVALRPDFAQQAAAVIMPKLLPRHISKSPVTRKTVTLVVNGRAVTMAGQMFRALAALDKAAHLANGAVTSKQIMQQLEHKSDSPQVNARMIDLVARGFVEEVRTPGSRMKWRPTNNGLALLIADAAPEIREAAHA